MMEIMENVLPVWAKKEAEKAKKIRDKFQAFSDYLKVKTIQYRISNTSGIGPNIMMVMVIEMKGLDYRVSTTELNFDITDYESW